MKIEQTIINALSLTKATGIPVLLFSNPGLGKTTILQRYAKNNDMHLETLIGSRFSPEEISGYQVNNGGNHLQHMSPEWYDRILKNEEEGKATLLFIDELSTCSEAVQGPLLSLIFDRTIGSEKYLPESTVIISAANYSANLSSYMNILSPALNRFCIINLNENYTSINLVEEFLDKVEIQYPSAREKMSEEEQNFFEKQFSQFWKDIFIKYSDNESPNGILDISNQNIGGIYSESGRYIYNFISGRSLSYLRDFIKAYIEYGMDDKEFLQKIADGFVGSGTCSFTEEEQKQNYRNYIYKGLEDIINQKQDKAAKLKLTGDISKDIASFIVSKDNLNTSTEDDLNTIVYLTEEIMDYFKIEKVLQRVIEPEHAAKFITDFESLIELQQLVSKYPDSKNIAYQITKVATDYYGLYCDMTGLTPDFQETLGVNNNLFERVCFLKIMETDGKEKIIRAGKRKSEKFTLPSFYLIEENASFMETGLTKIISPSKNFKVLIWKDGFKFRLIDNYLKTCKVA